MTNYTPEDFAISLLHRLRIKPTPGARAALVAWQKAEGGNWNNDARYNPLNTTQNMPGAGNTGSQGNIKVYQNWGQGLDATVKTLRNGRYGGILSALGAGDPAAVAQAIGSSPWGTKADLINRVMGGATAGPVGRDIGGSAAAGAPPVGAVAPPGGAPGSSAGAPPINPVFDIIKRYREATQPQTNTESLLGQGFDNEAATRNIQNSVKAILAAQQQSRQPRSPAGSIPVIGGETTGGDGEFKIVGASPGRLKPELVDFAKQVAAQFGEPLTGDSGATHSRLTVNGNVSEHYTGNATDIPAKGRRLIAMGQAALIAAGMDPAEARKQTGGLYNIGDHQIIFATNQGGNHFDHLHISTHAKRR